MDIQTIDQQYRQLEQQAQGTSQELSTLAGKLQAAAQAGDPNAREWLLDLKSVALSIQGEQNQVGLLLQALHGFVASQAQAMPPQGWAQQQAMPSQGWAQQPSMPAQAPQGWAQQPAQQGGGGFLGNLLNSGFGRAIEAGAGFGIGDDLINKIF